jgi:hypothetical protein
LAKDSVTPAGSRRLMIPLVVGGLIASALNMLWLDRLGPRTILIGGALAALAGIVIESALSPARALFLGATALLGLGVSALSGGPLRYVAARAVAASEQAAAQAAVAALTTSGSCSAARSSARSRDRLSMSGSPGSAPCSWRPA